MVSPKVREIHQEPTKSFKATKQQCRSDGNAESHEARDAGKGQTIKDSTTIER